MGNKLDFVFEAPKLIDNHVLQESTLASPTQTVILVQNDSTGEVCRMGPPEGFPQGGPIHVGNFGNIEWNDQVGSPVVQGSPFGNFENHVEEVQAQVTAAPQKLVTLQNVDQAMTTKYIIDIITNNESNVENNIEKFPSKNLDESSTDTNSRMAKIFAQTSNGSLVEFLANQQLEEENASKTNEANTGYSTSPPSEKRPPKRSAQNPVNSKGEMLSNSIHLTNGGPKPRKKGQEDTSQNPVNLGDFDLLSERTWKLLTIANQELPDEILKDIENSVDEFKETL